MLLISATSPASRVAIPALFCECGRSNDPNASEALISSCLHAGTPEINRLMTLDQACMAITWINNMQQVQAEEGVGDEGYQFSCGVRGREVTGIRVLVSRKGCPPLNLLGLLYLSSCAMDVPQ